MIELPTETQTHKIWKCSVSAEQKENLNCPNKMLSTEQQVLKFYKLHVVWINHIAQNMWILLLNMAEETPAVWIQNDIVYKQLLF